MDYSDGLYGVNGTSSGAQTLQDYYNQYAGAMGNSASSIDDWYNQYGSRFNRLDAGQAGQAGASGNSILNNSGYSIPTTTNWNAGNMFGNQFMPSALGADVLNAIKQNGSYGYSGGQYDPSSGPGTFTLGSMDGSDAILYHPAGQGNGEPYGAYDPVTGLFRQGIQTQKDMPLAEQIAIAAGSALSFGALGAAYGLGSGVAGDAAAGGLAGYGAGADGALYTGGAGYGLGGSTFGGQAIGGLGAGEFGAGAAGAGAGYGLGSGYGTDFGGNFSTGMYGNSGYNLSPSVDFGSAGSTYGGAPIGSGSDFGGFGLNPGQYQNYGTDFGGNPTYGNQGAGASYNLGDPGYGGEAIGSGGFGSGNSLADIFNNMGFKPSNLAQQAVKAIFQNQQGKGNAASNIAPYLMALNSSYQHNNASKQMQQWIQQQQDNIKNLYAPGSPEYNQLWQQMSRQDAAAGRNSQYGPRSVNLAAKIAQTKADAMARLSASMGSLQQNALNSGATARSSPDLAALLGNTATNQLVNKGLNYLGDQVSNAVSNFNIGDWFS